MSIGRGNIVSNRIACIDVDMTVVDIGTTWLDWLNNMTGKNLTMLDCEYDYNLGRFFEEDLKKLRMRPCDYFRSNTLYDTLKPIKGSVEALRWFKGQGWDIVFVTHVKGSHSKSKHNFLKRYFPFMDGYVVTKEKHYVKHDMLIDDRNNFLNRVDPSALAIKISTPYSQNEELKRKGVLSVHRWENFKLYYQQWENCGYV